MYLIPTTTNKATALVAFGQAWYLPKYLQEDLRHGVCSPSAATG